VQIDRGASYSPRYVTHLEKIVTGAGMSGGRQVGTGTNDASAAAADTAALSAVNAERRHRYGGSPGRASVAGSDPRPKEKSIVLSELVCLEVLAPVVTDDGDEEVRPSRLRAQFAAVKVGPYEMARADERSIGGE
jgi:hypothetical protein